MFWVATAPLSAQGHINLSPKGTADCFHVVNPKQVWYEDLSGSGNVYLVCAPDPFALTLNTAPGVETISHVRENGRITIMFCAFEGPPRILRLFGVGMCLDRVLLCSWKLAIPFVLHTGTAHDYGSSEYNRLIPGASRKPGSRAAIVINVYQVGSVRSRLLCITRDAHRVRLCSCSVMWICSPAVRLCHASHTAPPDVRQGRRHGQDACRFAQPATSGSRA
jgi:hypothetical protein